MPQNKEYIEKERAIKILKLYELDTDMVMRKLQNAPAADVVEVRHGRWEAWK